MIKETSDNNSEEQLSSADKAKLLIEQKKLKTQQAAEQQEREEVQKVEDVQNNLQEAKLAITTLVQEQGRLEQELEQVTKDIEEKFENVREAVTGLQKEELLESLDAEDREGVFGDDSLEITALQESKKTLEEKISENETRLAELESQKKELFHQTPEGEKEKGKEIKDEMREKLAGRNERIEPVAFDSMESLRNIKRAWLGQKIADLYKEYDRDQIKSFLADEYGKNVNKHFNTERERVISLVEGMEKVKDQESYRQGEVIKEVLRKFEYNNTYGGKEFLKSVELNQSKSLGEIQRILKEKELEINDQEAQAKEVIDLTVERNLLAGPETLSKFEDVDSFHMLKSQKESFVRRKENAKQAVYESMSLNSKWNDHLEEKVVLSGNNVRLEDMFNEITQSQEDYAQDVKGFEQQLKVADDVYNAEKGKDPFFGKDKHKTKVEGLKTERDNIERQLKEKKQEKRRDAGEAHPSIYLYFEKFGDSQLNRRNKEK